MAPETRELSPYSARVARTFGNAPPSPPRQPAFRPPPPPRQPAPQAPREESANRPQDVAKSIEPHKEREREERPRSRSRERTRRDTRERPRDSRPESARKDAPPKPVVRGRESPSPEPYRPSRERSKERRRHGSRDRRGDRSRDRKRDRSGERRRDHSRERKRDTSRDRRGDRAGEKEKEREKEKRRERSPDRRHGTGTGDRKRERSGDRTRDRSRDRHTHRDRSRSRDKKRDRSGDRRDKTRRSPSPPRKSRHHSSNSKRSPSPLPYRPSHKRRASPSPAPSKRRKHPDTASPAPRSHAPLAPQEITFRGTDNSDLPPTADGGAPKAKEKPNYKPTGLLARAANTVAGTKISLKYHEPPEARKPPPSAPWRLWIFKAADTLGTVELHTQSCWLLGRAREVCDIPLEHPSASAQHAAIQFRYITKQVVDADGIASVKGRVRPYVIDLDSSNGTELNGEEIESSRYVELRDKDVLRFGASEREYMVMLPPPTL